MAILMALHGNTKGIIMAIMAMIRAINGSNNGNNGK